jgi:hypothetical protein
MLNTNFFGMRFNDNTSIVTDFTIQKVKYLIFESSLKETSAAIYLNTQIPENLQKKAKILSHYVKELKKKKNVSEEKISNEMRIQL